MAFKGQKTYDYSGKKTQTNDEQKTSLERLAFVRECSCTKSTESQHSHTYRSSTPLEDELKRLQPVMETKKKLKLRTKSASNYERFTINTF